MQPQLGVLPSLQSSNGRGPAFYSPYLACQPNGGSNGGYGGVGLANTSTSDSLDMDCLQLTNSTRYKFNLYPYGYDTRNIFQGSGGSCVSSTFPSGSTGSGGGAFLAYTTNIIFQGVINASGLAG